MSMRPRRSSDRFQQESDDISRRRARPVEVPRTDAPRFLHFLLMVAARWAGRLRQKDKPKGNLGRGVKLGNMGRSGERSSAGRIRWTRLSGDRVGGDEAHRTHETLRSMKLVFEAILEA